MRISDWSSDVCSSDLQKLVPPRLCHRIFSGCQSFSQGVDGTILNSECRIAIFPMLNDFVGQYKGRREEGPVRATRGSPPRDNASRPEVVRARGAMRVPPVGSAEHTSELQSIMRISYAVFCLE